MPTPLPNSEKLGSFPLWDWIIDQSPGWGFLLMLLISPVAIKYIIRPAVEGRILRRRDEFMSFQFDMLLALAFGCGLVLVQAMPNTARGTSWLDWVMLLGPMAYGVYHFAEERKLYSKEQIWSLSKLWHELLWPLMGYAMVTVTVVGFCLAPWSFELVVMRVLMIAAIAAWALSWPLYDERHRLEHNDTGKNRYQLAHVVDSWPWQHKYAHLKEDWQRYIADWKQVPHRFLALWNRLKHL